MGPLKRKSPACTFKNLMCLLSWSNFTQCTLTRSMILPLCTENPLRDTLEKSEDPDEMPQNPEFRNNSENFYPCKKGSICKCAW